MAQPRRGSRRGFWRWLLLVLQWAVLAVGAVVVAALLSLQLRVVRVLIAHQVEGVLQSTFAGRVAIERLGQLSLRGIEGARVRIDDPTGTQVLLVDDASVRVATLATLRSLLKKEGDLVIDITSVKLGYVDANVDTDAAGNLKLLSAFEPKEKKPETPSARATVVHLRKIAMKHGWVHGQPKGAPLVDADLDGLDLSLIVGGDRTVADLGTLELRARALPQGLDLRTHLEAHYAKPAPSGGDQAGRADFKGEIGGVPFFLDASIDGSDVVATFDVPKLTPEQARRISPGLEPTQALAAHLDARGRLPDLGAKLHLEIGKGTLDLDARAALGDEKTVHATIGAKEIDVRALSRTAPASDLDANATIDFSLGKNGEGRGTYVLDIPAGKVGGNLVPSTHVEGDLEMSPSSEGTTELRVKGIADVDEPGARTRLRFELRQVGDTSTVDFQVNTVAGKLERTRVGNSISGSATLDAHGTAALGRATTVDVEVSLRASNVVSGETRLDRVELGAKVQGDIAEPTKANVDLNVEARHLTASGMRFATAAAAVRGSLHLAEATASLVPTDGPHVDADAWISLDDGVDVRNTRLTLAKDDVTAELRLGALRIKGDRARIEDVFLTGVGTPLRAEVTKTARALDVRAFTAALDLGKIGRLLQSREIGGGTLGVDVQMSVRPSAANGHVLVDLGNGHLGRVKDGTARIDAKFSGRRAEGSVHAKLGDVGQIDVDHYDVEIDGKAPLDRMTLADAKGRLAIDSTFDLTRIRAILPRGLLPFTDMQGVVRFKGNVARASTEEAPELEISAVTRGLYLSGRGASDTREQVHDTRVEPTPPWNVEGVDVELAAQVAKDSGATSLHSRLFDRQGTVVSVDASSPAMPYRQWLKKSAVDPKLVERLRWVAEIAVPGREFKRFPPFLKTNQMGGSFAASLHFDGSLAEPDLRMLVEASDWVTPAARGMSPINAKVDARYRDGQGALDLDIATRDKQLLEGSVEMRGALPGLPQPPGETRPPWRASTKMRLAEFPLEMLGILADLQLKGSVSGELAIDGVHEDARAKLALALRDLHLGRARFPRGNANVDFDGRALSAKLRLDQSDGFLDVEGRAGVRWGADPVPTLIKEEPAFAAVKASRFRAAALLPFAASVLGDLDGRIYADARIDTVPGAPPKMQGNVTLERGRLQLERVGEPMHGVEAKVTFSPDGIIRLEDLVAHGSSGRINAKGVARLNGFELVGARANIRIPKSDPFPLDIDGQAIGEIDADIGISADATPDRRTLNVKVDVPRLHTQLPMTSTNKPQELGEAEKIHVGYFRRPKQFVLLPKDAEDLEAKHAPVADKEATTTNVAIHLGDDVEIQRGTMLRVALTGDPKIELDDEPKMSGQIRLTHGTLEVQGKKFRVERGTVTFVGPPDNPQVVVSAYWDGPDGTRVYADFVGPLKTGTVKLRSEPARPQNEILALIMFGTAEGSSSTPYPTQQPNGATKAGVTVGGFATEGLSKGIDELTGLDVSAKIDTSTAANPKPEVEVQIARDISVQIAYVIGTPPPGVNPDKTFFSFDWRFKRNWSLETTFGDQGSSIVDFLWQYRY